MLGEFSSSLDSKLEFWGFFQYHYSFLSSVLFLGFLKLMHPLSGLDSDPVAVFGFPSAGPKSSKLDMLQLRFSFGLSQWHTP